MQQRCVEAADVAERIAAEVAYQTSGGPMHENADVSSCSRAFRQSWSGIGKYGTSRSPSLPAGNVRRMIRFQLQISRRSLSMSAQTSPALKYMFVGDAIAAAKPKPSSKLSVLALRHTARLMSRSGMIASAQNTGPIDRALGQRVQNAPLHDDDIGVEIQEHASGMIQQECGLPIHRLQAVIRQLMKEDRRAGRDAAANFASIADMDLPVEAERAERVAERCKAVKVAADRERINVHSCRGRIALRQS